MCNTNGAIPAKGNLLRVYANPRATADSTFIDLAWVRENVNGGGEVTIEFELNQVASPEPASFNNAPCPLTRTVGDLLVAFDFPNGNSAPVINLYRWTGTTWDAAVTPVTGSGAVNTASITAANDIFGSQINAERFGEATLNLTDLIGTAPGQLPCTAFNQLNTRSRSSNAVMNAALQDRINGIPINLCPGQPQPGQIIIEKQTTPNGSTQSFEFNPSYSDTNFFLQDGQQHPSGALTPNLEYTVGELVPGGWSLDSVLCNGTAIDHSNDDITIELEPGETITCVFNNRQIEPPAANVIIVDKNTVPANSPDSFHFTTNYGGFDLTAAAAPNNSGPLAPNVYSVAEDVPAGWELSSATCHDNTPAALVYDPSNIDLSQVTGVTVTCTFLDIQQGTIEVIKQLDPEDDPGRFDLLIDGTTERAAAGDNEGTGPVFVTPGDGHSVSEVGNGTTNLANYSTFIECTREVPATQAAIEATVVVASTTGTTLEQIGIDPGQHVTCTITNTRLGGTLQVVKALNPINDPGLFNLLIDNQTVITDRTNGGTTGFQGVDAGLHTAGETAGTNTSLANYTSSVSCTHMVNGMETAFAGGPGPSIAVNVAPEDAVTCTITNTRRPPGGGGDPGDGGDDYGTNPKTLPEEHPYAPIPGGQPAGDTGPTGGGQDEASAPDAGAGVAGTTAPGTAAPSDDSGNPVVEAVINTVGSPVNLPRTGAELLQQAIFGLILIGGGLLLMALRRRRSSCTPA